jgi:alkylresorcinol/alkylpyrone synthase
MKIRAVETAHPPNYYGQEALLAEFKKAWTAKHHNPARVDQLHRAVMVGGRHLALPMEEYKEIESFTDSNDHYIRVGTDIGEEALRKALAAADLEPSDVDAIFFVSVTGIATPSIDARLVNRLGLRSDVKRIPIFGLGCVAGAAGLGRVHDYLKAYPDQVAVLLSVELCSLTLQLRDLSVANLIASGLFGDGAACVVAIGDARGEGLDGPSVRTSRSRFYPDTEGVMGWNIGAEGFQVVLQARVPQLARDHLGDDLDVFLGSQGLERKDIGRWICHTGGPKVITAFQQAIGLSDWDVALTRNSLQEVGNLSSASVLYVLGDTIKQRKPAEGSYGVLMAMGPGFCCEMVLLQW